MPGNEGKPSPPRNGATVTSTPQNGTAPKNDMNSKTPVPPPAPTPPRAPPAPRAPPSTGAGPGSSTAASQTPVNNFKQPPPPVDSSANEPSSEITQAAARAVAEALGSMTYGIVGGGACSMLGGPRQTTDIDVVVCRNQTIEARRRLAAIPSHFSVDAPPTWYCFNPQK
ncbi:hypothetical protein N0V82_000857 [Gnomoniopsis sp. IMI 355080]|nr:hypothetical protein N0V82_000857 [Gnomoniopsis sp. IMI 355080]